MFDGRRFERHPPAGKESWLGTEMLLASSNINIEHRHLHHLHRLSPSTSSFNSIDKREYGSGLWLISPVAPSRRENLDGQNLLGEFSWAATLNHSYLIHLNGPPSDHLPIFLLSQ
jgi:hypothetical protein